MRNSPALKFGLGISRPRRRLGIDLQASPRVIGCFISGAGRCSWYPQNNATASTLASDKYFTSRILHEAGVPALGGEYFFLHARYRAHRPAGHERSDAIALLRDIGRIGLRQAADGIARRFRASRSRRSRAHRYLDEVTKYYDAVLIQPIVEGIEYRVFLLDDDALYCARKYPPSVTAMACTRFANCSPPITTPCAPAACRRPRCRKIHRSMPCRRRANGGTFPGG
jgi:hypothetical protein